MAVSRRKKRDLIKEIQVKDQRIAELEEELARISGTNEASQELLHLYRAIVEGSHSCILVINEKGRLVYVNQQVEEILGYSKDELIGETFQTFLAPEEVERVTSYHLRRQKGEPVPNRYELQIKRKDGQIRIAEIRLQMFRDRKNQPRTVAQLLDITDRKRAQQALIESRKKLMSIFEAIADALTVTDTEARIVDCNEAMIRMYGYNNKQEVIGLSALDLIHPDDRAIAMEDLRLAIVQKTPRQRAYRCLRKSGEVFPVELSAAALLDTNSRVIGFVGITKDITERIANEERIKTLAHALESVREFVTITDLNDQILYVNRAFLKAYGYTREQVTGQHIAMLRAPDNPPNIGEEIHRSTLQGGWSGELLNQDKNGRVFPIFLSTSVVRDEQGKPEALIGVATDISQQKEMENQLRQVQKMEAIGRLAGGIAHDFNNLLTVINGYCDLLLMQELPSPTVRKGIEEIQKAGEKAAALTAQLLAFGRKQIVQPSVFSLNDFLHEIRSMLTRLIGEEIEIVYHLNEAIGHIRADKSQIQQVLLNLVINARDAMPGGGRITIETSEVDARELPHSPKETKKSARYIHLAVSDTGIGMNEEVQTHIFEPFFTTKGMGKGTGLGLSIVYGIVRQNGGFVTVHSTPGQGSTFHVFLPAVKPQKHPRSPHRSVATDLHGTETILVVEDQKEVRDLIHHALNQYGYTIIIARDGLEALEICRKTNQKIDLILTDVIMPHMNGPQLVRKMLQLYPNIRVIFMSGYTDKSIPKEELNRLNATFIQKPFSHNQLIEKIRELLNG